MRMPFRIVCRSIAAVALAATFVPAAQADSDRVAAADLKAAFLLNFVTFTDWPGIVDAATRVCVVDDPSVAEALSAAVRARTGSARSIVVDAIAPDAPMRECQVLFLGAANANHALAMLEQTAAVPTLTVSDVPHFAESGGMIGLFLAAGKMRFAVNVDAVQRGRLRLSSRLLSLAKIVKDTHAQ